MKEDPIERLSFRALSRFACQSHNNMTEESVEWFSDGWLRLWEKINEEPSLYGDVVFDYVGYRLLIAELRNRIDWLFAGSLNKKKWSLIKSLRTFRSDHAGNLACWIVANHAAVNEAIEKKRGEITS